MIRASVTHCRAPGPARLADEKRTTQNGITNLGCPMSGETYTTIVGNLTADPELRFTPSGAAVASFTIASTPRVFDRNSNEWRDGDTMFIRCNLWRQAAENAAESLARGTRVIAYGKLQQRSYETREGEKRTVIELLVDEIGASIAFATLNVKRASRRSEITSTPDDEAPIPDEPPATEPAKAKSGGRTKAAK